MPAKISSRRLIQPGYKLSTKCLSNLFSPSKYTDNLTNVTCFLNLDWNIQIYRVGLKFQEACVLKRRWNFELIQWPQEQGFSRKALIIVIIVSWKYQEFQQTDIYVRFCVHIYICACVYICIHQNKYWT